MCAISCPTWALHGYHECSKSRSLKSKTSKVPAKCLKSNAVKAGRLSIKLTIQKQCQKNNPLRPPIKIEWPLQRKFNISFRNLRSKLQLGLRLWAKTCLLWIEPNVQKDLNLGHVPLPVQLEHITRAVNNGWAGKSMVKFVKCFIFVFPNWPTWFERATHGFDYW